MTDPFQRQTPSWYAWWIGLDLSVWKSHPSLTSRCQSRTPQPVVWCEGHAPYDCDDAEQKNVPHALSSRQHPKHNNNNNTNCSSVAHVRQVLRSKKPNCAANRHFSPVDLLECLAKPVIQRLDDANQKNCVLPDNDIGKLVVFWQWKMRCRCAKSEGH